MTGIPSRSAFDLIEELLALTREMSVKADDETFLLAGIDKRQLLMDEYNREFGPPGESKQTPEIRRMVDEIIALDRQIGEALSGHRDKVKQEVSASNIQKRVLNYTNHAIASTGSYMDYKK